MISIGESLRSASSQCKPRVPVAREVPKECDSRSPVTGGVEVSSALWLMGDPTKGKCFGWGITCVCSWIFPKQCGHLGVFKVG